MSAQTGAHLTVETSWNTEEKTMTEKTPTNSIKIYTPPHKGSFVESVSKKLPKPKNYNTAFEIPERMEPDTKTITLQISLCITGGMAALIYVFARDIIGIYYPSAFLWIVTATIFAYHEIDYASFTSCITTFRGLIISTAVFISILCDCVRHFLTQDDNELFFTVLLGNVAWTYAIVYMIFLTDSAPKVLNFVRFLGPVIILLHTLWYIIDHYFWRVDDNVVLFSFSEGALTLNEIEVWCKVQILWFGSSFVLSVFRDPKHEYYVLNDERILTKLLLPYRNFSSSNTTFCFGRITIKTYQLFRIMTVIASVYGALYLFILYYDKYNFSEKGIPICIELCLCLAVLLYTICGILFANYFQILVVQTLLVQFRANMLLVTILILSYGGIQTIIWKTDIDAMFIVSTIANYSVLILSVFALWIRDAMNILYPWYFVVYLGILVCVASVWNIFLLTFHESNNGYQPLWFTVLQKQAYIQIILSWWMCLYYFLRDRNSHYFVLIRERRQTKAIWKDSPKKYTSVSDYDIDASSFIGNRSRQGSQIDTLNSVNAIL